MQTFVRVMLTLLHVCFPLDCVLPEGRAGVFHLCISGTCCNIKNIEYTQYLLNRKLDSSIFLNSQFTLITILDEAGSSEFYLPSTLGIFQPLWIWISCSLVWMFLSNSVVIFINQHIWYSSTLCNNVPSFCWKWFSKGKY